MVFSSNGLRDLIGRLGDKGFFGLFALNLVASFFAVLTAFVLHEIGHKIVANHYGYPAAFAYSRNGLIFAVLLSLLFGVLIGAPGAVLIYGYPSKKENGIISIAGPMTNLLVAAFSFVLLIIAFFVGSILSVPQLLINILFLVTTINVFIGAFNMIPIGVLDGAKILRWSKIAYFTLLAFYIPGIVLFFIFPIIS